MHITSGNSMRPAILSGAELIFKDNCDRILKGDVIAFIDEHGSLVAHRVIDITDDGSDTIYVTKGDASQAIEYLPKSAVIGVVESVKYEFFSYSTKGPAGILFARMALGKKRRWKLLKRVTNIMVGFYTSKK
ncbi:MAG: signal peptidase I [Deltaproteobacteria bacterium]|nr:signal peptidase I [Deltaproteobacteria bacterium]